MASGKRIVEGLKAAVSFAKGDTSKGRLARFNVPDDVDVKAIRQKLGLSQKAFALQFGFSLGTLRHWEQGDRHPEGSARVLLTLIGHNPEVVQKTMNAVAQRKAMPVKRVANAR